MIEEENLTYIYKNNRNMRGAKKDIFLPFIFIVLVVIGCQAPEPTPPVANNELLIDSKEKEEDISPNETHIYSVHVSKQKKIYVFLEGQYNLLPKVEVLTTKGYSFPYRNFNSNRADRIGIWVAPNREETLFIKITSTKETKYRINVKGGCGNGSLETLEELKIGNAPLQGYLTDNSFRDYFFESNGKKITLFIDSESSFKPMIEILNENCDSLGEGNKQETEIRTKFEGKYFIRVKTTSNKGGKYRISLR